MFNSLISNKEAAPAPVILFPDIQGDIPIEVEIDDVPPKPLLAPLKEWIEAIYTFQDV